MPAASQRPSRVAAAGLLFLLLGCQRADVESTAQSASLPPTVDRAASPPAEETPEPASAEPTEPVPTDAFPTFGVALTPPEGWRAELSRPQVGFLARWLPDTEDPDDWAQFAAEVRPLRGNAEQRRAEEDRLAAPFERGGYRRSQITLAGEPATRYDAPPLPTGAERRPVPSPVIVASRGGLVYRTLFLLNDPTDDAPVEPVLASWQWADPAPVAEHLRVETPQSLFDGLGELNLPAIARIDPEFTSADAAGFTVFDYRAAQDAIIFVFERDLTPEPPSLREHVVGYAELIEGRTKLDLPLAFNQLPDLPNVYASEMLQGQFEDGGQMVGRLCRYAVWRPRAGALIRIQAVVNNEVLAEPAELAAAVAAVDRAFRSCSGLLGVGGK